MVTMAQRIEELRTQKGISRPALSAALGLPRTAAEKFETGRQTPSQNQQKKLAEYFGVSLHYLRGESDDPEQMETWLNGGALTQDEPTVSVPRPAVKAKPKPAAVQEDGAVFGALLKSTGFQAMIRNTIMEVLRSPEGQELLTKAVRRELERR